MRCARRITPAAATLLAVVAAVTWGALSAAVAVAHPARVAASAGSPSVTRFSLAGYVLDTKYTLGRNTGNTFQQTYRKGTVHGVPIAGPYVGTKFPVEDYVAMPIGNHELFVAWLGTTKSHPLLDVFVMNFRTHVVFDYAPGSTKPESSGTVAVVRTGASRAP